MRRAFCLPVAFVLMLGCRGGASPYPGYGSTPTFDVKVQDAAGQPVQGARVFVLPQGFGPAAVTGSSALASTGGGGYGGAYGVTDSSGVAKIPVAQRGYSAYIGKTNYLVLDIASLQGRTYTIQPAPMKLTAIGAVGGQPLGITADHTFTVSLAGDSRSTVLNVYRYTDAGVTLVKSVILPGFGTYLGNSSVSLIGDDLWYATPLDGLYLFSLSDPENPTKQLNLPVPGGLVVFATNGNTLVTAIAQSSETYPLRIHSYTALGEVRGLAHVGDHATAFLWFKGTDLVVVSRTPKLISVYDLSDPANPALAAEGDFPSGPTIFQVGDRLIASQSSPPHYPPFSYSAYDLADPRHPLEWPNFTTDAPIVLMPSETDALSESHLRIFQE
ncbi:MAG: hypothetical protein ACREJQ_04080 [bacterium]